MKNIVDKIIFRTASIKDLSSIIKLLSEIQRTPESKEKEETDNHFDCDSNYLLAFEEISKDPNNDLIVGELENEVVALLQITFIPGLTLNATKRAHLEGVRVLKKLRGKGIGKMLINYSIKYAKKKGCGLLQLTTNHWRQDAISFYKGLGFEETHIGLRIDLA